MHTLEDALGAPALLRLKDWLNTRFPDGNERIRSQEAVYQMVEQAISQPVQSTRHRVERYNDHNGREWFRVIDTATGDVAVRPSKGSRNVRQRLAIKLDYFLSESEACRAVWSMNGIDQAFDR